MSKGTLNKVMLIGNLGKDPVMRYTPDGKAIANFSIATSETWKDKSTGEKQEKSEWHRIVAFNKLAEIVDEYLKSGHKCYIEGRLQTRKYADKQGVERYTTEIVMDTLEMLGGKEKVKPEPAPVQEAQEVDPDFDPNIDIPF